MQHDGARLGAVDHLQRGLRRDAPLVAQGLPHGGELRADALGDGVVVEPDDRHVPRHADAALAHRLDGPGRDAVRTREQAVDGVDAVEQVAHGQKAVARAPAGVDDPVVGQGLVAEHAAVAQQAVDDRRVVPRPQDRHEVPPAAPPHGVGGQPGALHVVGVDGGEHVAVGMALELAAQDRGDAQVAQGVEQLAALVGGDVDHGVDRAAGQVAQHALALVVGGRLQQDGQVGRFRQLLGDAAEEGAVGGVGEQFARRLGDEHGDGLGPAHRERAALGVGDEVDLARDGADALLGGFADAR